MELLRVFSNFRPVKYLSLSPDNHPRIKIFRNFKGQSTTPRFDVKIFRAE